MIRVHNVNFPKFKVNFNFTHQSMSAIGPIKFCTPFALLMLQSAADGTRYLFPIACDALNTFGNVHYVIHNIYKISSM
jgi:hypothetical protein